jgi:hypothetical protein
MTNFKWKILETVIEGGILKRVKYWCQGTTVARGALCADSLLRTTK